MERRRVQRGAYQGGSILPQRGLEEKEVESRSKYSSPKRMDKEGILMRHIRGKYRN